jgi:hypothetical protein
MADFHVIGSRPKEGQSYEHMHPIDLLMAIALETNLWVAVPVGWRLEQTATSSGPWSAQDSAKIRHLIVVFIPGDRQPSLFASLHDQPLSLVRVGG